MFRIVQMEKVIATLLFIASGALAYPKGAPNSACEFMMPGHGVIGQLSDAPYTITASESCYKPNQQMKVTIESDPGMFLVGFLLKSSKKDESMDVGTFPVPDGGQLQSRCSQHGLTHTKAGRDYFKANNLAKIEMVWIAPNEETGDVFFRATIVKEKLVFWVAVPSAMLPECPPEEDVCEDSLTKKNPLNLMIDGNTVKINNCKKLVNCYPQLCETHGQINGKCCKRCKTVGTPECLDKASKCTPIQLNLNGKEKKITKCKKQLKSAALMGFCSPDALGSDACCNYCSDKCVDSLTWKAKSRKCKNCTCAMIKTKGLMDKCCAMKWKGNGSDGKKYNCKEMCCDSCA